jgi:serine protease Do
VAAVSLFDDDFYAKGKQQPERGRSGKFAGGLILLSLGFGLLLTVMVFPYLAKKGYVEIDLSQSKSEKVIAIAERAQPAIVSIFGYYEQEAEDDFENMDLSYGSGIVIAKTKDKAQIITNYHVIQDVKKIEVLLLDGKRLKAKLIAGDNLSDLALLEVDGKSITHVAQLGNSERVRVGEAAIVIGNPLDLGSTPTITSGIISSVKRTIPVSLNQDGVYDWEQDVIQTDAAVNQGNSGGALINLHGEVIGIISMKIHDIGVEGLAFAIPINHAKPIIEQMIQFKKVKRPYIGIVMHNLQDFVPGEPLGLPKSVTKGVVVLEAQGPAKKAGLKADDVIVALDEIPVEDGIDLRRYLYEEKAVGDRIQIDFYRDGKKQQVKLRLEELFVD